MAKKPTEVLDAEIVTSPEEEAKLNEAVTKIEEEIKANPNIFMKLIERAKNNPTLGRLGTQNAHSAKMAALGRAGKLLLSRIRNNVLRPLLPDQYKGVLDNPLVCGVIDLAVGNALFFIGVEFGDKLPPKLQPYASKIGEAAMYSAYSDTFGTFDIEDIFNKLLSGEMFSVIKNLVDTEA